MEVDLLITVTKVNGSSGASTLLRDIEIALKHKFPDRYTLRSSDTPHALLVAADLKSTVVHS